MCKSPRGLQESKVQTDRSFPKREMKVGVCAGPCILPLGLGHTLGPPRRLPPGQTNSFSSGQKRDRHTRTPLSSTGLRSSHGSRRRGDLSSALRSKISLVTTYRVSSILQTGKLRLDMDLGQGRTQCLGHSRETKSPAGLGAQCLLCRIKTT